MMNYHLYFAQNDNKEIPDYWNKTNIECFKRLKKGLGCKDCYYNKVIEQDYQTNKHNAPWEKQSKCVMKYYVLRLIKQHGTPNIDKQDK